MRRRDWVRLIVAMLVIVVLGLAVTFVVGGGDAGCSTRRDGRTEGVCTPGPPARPGR